MKSAQIKTTTQKQRDIIIIVRKKNPVNMMRSEYDRKNRRHLMRPTVLMICK